MDPIANVGQSAPDFSLKDLNGILHRLEDVLGRIVIINFWSAECPWSEKIDKKLAELLSTAGADISLWSIASNVNEPMDMLMSGVEVRGLPVVLRDQNHAVADLYGAVTTPHFFLIDSDGILQYKGAFDDATFRQPDAAQDYLGEALQAVQASRQPDPMETPGYGCAIIRFAEGD